MTKRLIMLLLCAFPSLAYAGAWTQEKGAAQLITTVGYSNAGDFYDKTGRSRSQATYQSLSLSTYGEYGLCNAVTIGGQLAASRASQTSKSNIALLDTNLFARFRLWRDEQSVVSLQPYVEIPSNWHTTNNPSLGSDDYSAGLRGAYGRNIELFGHKGYVDIAASYLYRGGDAGDQLKLDLTSEIALNAKWSVMPQVFITHARDGVGSSAFTQSTADDYNLATLQLSGLYKLTDASKIQVGASHAVDGKNTGKGYGVFVGYWVNF